MSEEDFDIIQHFQDEAYRLYEELDEIVEELEDHDEYPIDQLEDFAQKIDRIMGSAETIHANDPEIAFVDSIAIICRLCKQIGYNAKNFQKPELLPIYSAFWADCLEVLESLTKAIQEPHKLEDQMAYFTRTLEKRLQWLLDKLKESQPEDDSKQVVDQADIDALLKSLGV